MCFFLFCKTEKEFPTIAEQGFNEDLSLYSQPSFGIILSDSTSSDIHYFNNDWTEMWFNINKTDIHPNTSSDSLYFLSKKGNIFSLNKDFKREQLVQLNNKIIHFDDSIKTLKLSNEEYFKLKKNCPIKNYTSEVFGKQIFEIIEKCRQN